MPTLPPEPPGADPASALATELVAALAAGGERAGDAAARAGEFLAAGVPDEPARARAFGEVVDILRAHLRVVTAPEPQVVDALVLAGAPLAGAALHELLGRALASGWDRTAAAALGGLAELGDEDLAHDLVVGAARSGSPALREAAVAWLARPVAG